MIDKEEDDDIKEYCTTIKQKFDNEGRPFILAVGSAPEIKNSNNGVIITGTYNQLEYLIFSILKLVAEEDKKEDNNE